MDATGLRSGAPVPVRACDGSAGQQWRHYSSDLTLRPQVDEGLCLTDADADNKPMLQLLPCGSTNQQLLRSQQFAADNSPLSGGAILKGLNHPNKCLDTTTDKLLATRVCDDRSDDQQWFDTEGA